MRLLVEGVASAVGGGDGVEVGRAGVGGLVELVYHIIIKLFCMAEGITYCHKTVIGTTIY